MSNTYYCPKSQFTFTKEELDNEEWRPVMGFEGLYSVSNLGRIKRDARVQYQYNSKADRIVAVHYSERLRKHGRAAGYHHVVLSSRGGPLVGRQVHRLVLESFIGPRPEGKQCRHLNGNPDDNRLVNLTWGTPAENMMDRDRHGNTNRGEDHPQAILTEAIVRDIKTRYAAGGITQKELADEYGISRPYANQLIHGRKWSHVTL